MSRWGLFCNFEDHFHFSIIFLNFGFRDPKSLFYIPISQERFRVGAFAGGSAAELPSLEEELAQVLIIPYFGTDAMKCTMFSIFWGRFRNGHCTMMKFQFICDFTYSPGAFAAALT